MENLEISILPMNIYYNLLLIYREKMSLKRKLKKRRSKKDEKKLLIEFIVKILG
jgi:hypothetical protein